MEGGDAVKEGFSVSFGILSTGAPLGAIMNCGISLRTSNVPSKYPDQIESQPRKVMKRHRFFKEMPIRGFCLLVLLLGLGGADAAQMPQEAAVSPTLSYSPPFSVAAPKPSTISPLQFNSKLGPLGSSLVLLSDGASKDADWSFAIATGTGAARSVTPLGDQFRMETLAVAEVGVAKSALATPPSRATDLGKVTQTRLVELTSEVTGLEGVFWGTIIVAFRVVQEAGSASTAWYPGGTTAKLVGKYAGAGQADCVASLTLVVGASKSSTPPQITTQPTLSVDAASGSKALKLSASGPELKIQWYKDGKAVSKATNPTLLIKTVDASTAGTYTAVVQNGFGAVTSEGVEVIFSDPTVSEMKWIKASEAQQAMDDFYIGETEVTYSEWKSVLAWALKNKYSFTAVSSEATHYVVASRGQIGVGKGDFHPAILMNWWDAVKWCNAKSEKEGKTPCYYTSSAKTAAEVYRRGDLNLTDEMVLWSASGYRLPTSPEWEFAARGGLIGKEYPWGDTISQAQANYCLVDFDDEKPGGKAGIIPRYAVGKYPFTNPVKDFDPNGYGLYGMAGNVREWCWTRYDENRVIRGGGWKHESGDCAVWREDGHTPDNDSGDIGFRVVRR
jgi:sulfatase modifying factor 1